jgi:signal transduction histidine kinase
MSVIDLSRLNEPEERLRLFTEQVPVRACATDRELRVVWDLGAGFPESPGPMGKTVAELFAESPDRDRVLQACRRALAGDPSKLEIDDGKDAAFLQLEPFRDRAGNVVGVLGLAYDITERVRAEKGLRKAERLLVEAEKLGHTGGWEYDLVSREIFKTDENQRLFFGDDRSRGAQLEDYVEAVHPDDRPRVLQRCQQLLDGTGPPDAEYRVVWPDGSVHVLFGLATVIRDAAARPVRVYGTNADITERKRTEDELNRRAQQQAVMAQLSFSALKGDGLQRLFENAANLIARTLGVEYGAVLEWFPEKEVMEFRARAGLWSEDVIRRVTVATAPGFMAWFFLHSQVPIVVEDLLRETRFAPCELLLEHGVKSGIAVPIAGKQRPFGVLEANATQLRTFSEDEVSFVWSVANLLGTAIEQSRAAGELRENREQLQALSRKLIEAQEAERRAVARELHDDFGQMLTAIKLDLMRRDRGDAETIALVDGAIGRVRELAHDLRPPMLDELGLPASLRWYVEREARRAGLDLRLLIDMPETRPAPTVETTCFRVAQEAFTNLIRHAQARRVDVELGVAAGALQLVVRDDGRGFDLAAAGRRAAQGESLGLLSMQERVALAGGELKIDSAPGHGTTVRARFLLQTHP